MADCCRRSPRAAPFPSSSRQPSVRPVGQTTGRHSHQLRLPHHSCRSQAAGAVEAARRSEGADRAAAQAAEGRRRRRRTWPNTVQTLARTVGMDKAATDKGLTVTTTDFVAQTDPLPGVGNAHGLGQRAVFGQEERSCRHGADVSGICGLSGDRHPAAANADLRADQGAGGRAVQGATRASAAGAEDAGAVGPRPRRTRPEEGGQGSWAPRSRPAIWWIATRRFPKSAR